VSSKVSLGVGSGRDFAARTTDLDKPSSSIREFMNWMPDYESMGWPMGQMGGFWTWLRGRSQWLDIQSIVRNISGAHDSERKDAICVMVGNQDVLMDLGMSRKSATEYRAALQVVQDGQKQKLRSVSESDSSSISAIDGTMIESAAGVQLVIVDGAGHHLQNDVQRDAGAEALLQFVRQC